MPSSAGKKKLPPANAFWSLTLYDAEGYQVANPLGRFAVGSHFSDNALAYNPDGSLYKSIQADGRDAALRSHWLPAPRGDFNLALRLDSPMPEMREGIWTPPGRERIGCLNAASGGKRLFFFNDTVATEIYTLSLHDALPI